MKKLWLVSLLSAVALIGACASARPVNVLSDDSAMVTASAAASLPSKAPTATVTGVVPSSAATATAQSALPTPTAATTKPVKAGDFMTTVATGLKDRWAGSQAIVVRADSANSANAQMWLYERSGDTWAVASGPWPAVVGRNGVSKQGEGDGRSPSGAFLLGTAFGWAAKPEGMKYQYQKLDGDDRWVDDSGSPFYNNWVRGSADACGTGESLLETKQYKYAMAVHYNDEAITGDGSAIFMHVWSAQGQGTSGCTAVSEKHMISLLKWLDYSKRPVLVQGTEEQIEQLMQEDWGMSCLPEGWGFADDFVQDAQREIRYNTDNNFTGQKLVGYSASQAPMKMDAIKALAAAASQLRSSGLGIRIYDAYRPQKATDAMIAWAEDISDTATKKEYYPDIDKASIPGVYVARKSGHRLGGTVDLTLLQWDSGNNLDMGGTFDFFGKSSSASYSGLTKDQAHNRNLLRAVMIQSGFQPYDSEWWHFTYPAGGEGGDFLILPREHRIE